MSADQSRPVPRASEVQGIDRDALLVLLAEFGYDGAPDRAKLADAVLALLRPIEGVTETDIDLLRECAEVCQKGGLHGTARRLHGLAARLEVSS